MKKPYLYHFKPNEFVRADKYGNEVNWYDQMDPRLLVLLDVARFQWDKPIAISAHPEAIGRQLGDSLSDHNIDRWGKVMGIDVMPEGINTTEDARAFRLLARDLGFTAIGFYPHWKPRPGFHLGVRADREMGKPAEWGFVRVNEKSVAQVSINDAMEMLA